MKNSNKVLRYEPFSFTTTKGGSVQIAYQGKVVTILARKAASSFLAKAERIDPADQQLLMAKATGNFKHGNERPVDPRHR